MAANVGSAVRVTTGLLSANGGINSGVVPTIAGQANPDGLKPNNLAFGNNCTVRDSGISPRPGWIYLATMPTADLFQVGYMYEQPGEFPYLVWQIGGRTWRIRVDTDNSIDEITIPGDPNDPNIPLGFMVQGEQFLIIQDGIANPLFWDGATMRRSLGDSQVVGIYSILANNSAIGNAAFMNVGVVVPPGYTGLENAILNIGGFLYQQVVPTNAVTLTNNDDPSIGLTIAAGTLIYDGVGNQVGTVLPETTIPAFAGTQNTFAAYTTPLPANVVINGYSYTVALAAPPWVPNANTVRLINLNAPFPGSNPAGTAIETMPELPPAECMDYYMGRIWLAKGRQYIAGDIVRGPSGTAQYDYTDSILKNTENAYIAGGGAFTVPTLDGNIRALKHPANLNTALGQGQLLPMTRRVIYSTNVVPERAAWAALSEPLQRVAQINFGTVSDRSCVSVNGDLFYQSVDGVRSLQQSVRQFDVQWGDVPLSNEEIRVISRNDRSLLRFATGVEFNNRLLQSALPFQSPVGVAHPGLMPLNFDLLNSMNNKLPPVWEGLWEGLNVLQMFKGDFGGRQRSFAAVWSDIHQAIEVWELSTDALEDSPKEEQGL